MIGDQNSVKSGQALKKTPVPQLVKFNRAFKLAEQWVSKMSYLGEDDKSSKPKLESRPPRLGVGATVARQPQVIHSNDPVERKISTLLETQKRRGLKNAEELTDSVKTSRTSNGKDLKPSPKVGSFIDDSDDEELESKTKAFQKKRPLPSTSNLQAKKKQR